MVMVDPLVPEDVQLPKAVKFTGSPEVAVALTVNGTGEYGLSDSASKMIV
jgi:hypothetical protein